MCCSHKKRLKASFRKIPSSVPRKTPRRPLSWRQTAMSMALPASVGRGQASWLGLGDRDLQTPREALSSAVPSAPNSASCTSAGLSGARENEVTVLHRALLPALGGRFLPSTPMLHAFPYIPAWAGSPLPKTQTCASLLPPSAEEHPDSLPTVCSQFAPISVFGVLGNIALSYQQRKQHLFIIPRGKEGSQSTVPLIF